MFNRQRTLELLGYDFDPSRRRRTRAEINAQPDVVKKSNLKVIDNCPQCGIERKITYQQSKKDRPCSKCFHAQPHIQDAKRNQNKSVSEETKQRMRDNHWSKSGNYSPLGRTLSKKAKENVAKSIKKWNQEYRDRIGEKEYRITRSCISQKINRSDFKGFTSPELVKIRQSQEYKDWEDKVKLRDNNRCVLTGSSNITVHHLNSFAQFPDERFDVDNGVCLDKEIHNMYHNIAGRRNNSKDEFQEFLQVFENKPVVYLVAGVSASGKSWVCEHFMDNYVSYDDSAKNHHVYYIYKKYLNHGGPVLYDRFTNISTFIKHFSSILDIKLVTIVEDTSVLEKRLRKRGGASSPSWYKRMARIKNLSKQAEFSGTSQQVLEYFQKNMIKV